MSPGTLSPRSLPRLQVQTLWSGSQGFPLVSASESQGFQKLPVLLFENTRSVIEAGESALSQAQDVSPRPPQPRLSAWGCPLASLQSSVPEPAISRGRTPHLSSRGGEDPRKSKVVTDEGSSYGEHSRSVVVGRGMLRQGMDCQFPNPEEAKSWSSVQCC